MRTPRLVSCRKIPRVFIGIFFLVFLIGCMKMDALLSGPPLEVQNKADYGPKPENFEQLVREHFYNQLIDPGSAMYQFKEPGKAWLTHAKFDPPHYAVFGWRICGLINSKNRYGGYVGWKPFFVFVSNGKIMDSQIGSRAYDFCQ
jgi:hypothetical protein